MVFNNGFQIVRQSWRKLNTWVRRGRLSRVGSSENKSTISIYSMGKFLTCSWSQNFSPKMKKYMQTANDSQPGSLNEPLWYLYELTKSVFSHNSLHEDNATFAKDHPSQLHFHLNWTTERNRTKQDWFFVTPSLMTVDDHSNSWFMAFSLRQTSLLGRTQARKRNPLFSLWHN